MNNRFALVPITADLEEPRCPCVLVLDVSSSMQSGGRIDQLNKGLQQFATEMANDALASKRIEVAIVTFGSDVKVELDFTQARDFRPPTLTTSGLTPMGEAVCTAVDMVAARKEVYKQSGVDYYRPWIFLITDGAPTDVNSQHWPEAVSHIADGDSEGTGGKKFSFFAVGVDGSDFTYLRTLSTKEPLALKGLMFGELFQWLSASMQAVSGSSTDDELHLSDPSGWGTIAPR